MFTNEIPVLSRFARLNYESKRATWREELGRTALPHARVQHSRISLSRIKRENTFNARRVPRTRRRTVRGVLEVVFPDGCIYSNKNRDVHTLWKQTRPGADRDEIFAKLLATLRTCSLLLCIPQ